MRKGHKNLPLFQNNKTTGSTKTGIQPYKHQALTVEKSCQDAFIESEFIQLIQSQLGQPNSDLWQKVLNVPLPPIIPQMEAQRLQTKMEEVMMHHEKVLLISQQFKKGHKFRGRPKNQKNLTKKLSPFWKLIRPEMMALISCVLIEDNREDLLVRFQEIRWTKDRFFQYKWFARIIKQAELIPYISRCLMQRQYNEMIKSLRLDQAKQRAYINQRIPLLLLWLQEKNNLAFRNWYHLCYLTTENRS